MKAIFYPGPNAEECKRVAQQYLGKKALEYYEKNKEKKSKEKGA